LKKLRKTVTALRRLEQELYASQPDTILTISPHGTVEDETFTLDFNERYTCDLREFGIMDCGLEFRVDMRLASALKELLEDRGVPLMLRSAPELDYGNVVPLSYLTAHLPDVKILPLSPAAS
jgi:aromatic ring-opening dioxygenase catalytic subunit (LigB family)